MSSEIRICLVVLLVGLGAWVPRLDADAREFEQQQGSTASDPSNDPPNDPSESGEAGWEAYLDDTPSQSIGESSRGRLRRGRLMPWKGDGFVRRNNKAPYGTNETVAILLWAFQQMHRMYPGTVPAVIGDLSAERGGRLRPHASHQSGRDADIGYYQVNNVKNRRFADCSPENIDLEKTWSFLELLLSTDRVEYLFIDIRIQERLYLHAQERGWEEDELQELFEAPLGAHTRKGIIRHAPGHGHHVHIRFHCPAGDQDCQ